jgi:hypothetical protein
MMAAVLDQNQAKLRILSGNGEGSFQLTHTYPTSGSVPRKMLQRDFDVDGDTDFVVCNMGTEYHTAYNLVYFEGTGQGTFEPAVIIQNDYVPESIVSGDFNTDGNTDLIFKAFDRDLAKMWGNGDGTFQDPELEEISAIYYAIYLHEADINFDGALDLGMACYTFNMHVNDGSGNFSDSLYINEKSNSHKVNEIGIGYFNGDLKPDVISTHSNMPDLTYGAITVYLNCLPVAVPEDEYDVDLIRLYPNPGNGLLRIDSDQSLIGLQVARIFNCNGMTIDESLYSMYDQSLDLSSQGPGLYFIQFIYGSQTINKKVIIY